MISPGNYNITQIIQGFLGGEGYAGIDNQGNFLWVESDGSVVVGAPGSTSPEPMAAIVSGMTPLGSQSPIIYAIAVSGNVYSLGFSSTGEFLFTAAGNVGFAGVISAISPGNIHVPISYAANPPAGAILSPIVVGAKGNAAMQVGVDPTTQFSYWAPLTLTPPPNGDDLVQVYA